MQLNAQNSDLVVEVAAFAEQVSMSYFDKVENVYETIDVNQIYRYRIDVNDQAEAKKVLETVQAEGFQYARIVDIAALRQQCEAECGYVPPKPTGAGNIGLDDASQYELNSRSGNIDVGNANAYELNSRSGNIDLDDANQYELNSQNGEIDLADIDKFEFKEGEKIKCLFFDYDSYLLRNTSQKELNKVAWFLTKNPNHTIQILSHTDAQGSDSYNQRLAQNRANMTKKYLMRLGVKRGQIRTKVFGEKKPIAINQTPDGQDCEEGRQYNRRIELTIYDEEGKMIDLVEEIFVPEELQPDGK